MLLYTKNSGLLSSACWLTMTVMSCLSGSELLGAGGLALPFKEPMHCKTCLI